MNSSKKSEINFMESLFGLILQPGETCEKLLRQDNPPFAYTYLLCFILSIFVPIFAQLFKYGVTVYNPEALLSVFLVIFFTFLFFVLMEALFLRLCGVDCDFKYIFASVCYCIGPLLFALWLIYFFNYLSTGRLSIVHLIMTGNIEIPDRFINVIPIALLISQLTVLVILFYCIRFLGEMYSETALLVTLLSLIPFALALGVGLYLGDLAKPGTQQLFWKVLFNPAALTTFHL